MADRVERWIEVGRRVDGTSWRIHVIEHRGEHRSDVPGGRSVILGGMLGDKPLGSLAVHAIDRYLSEVPDLAGEVVLVPAANPPALEHATRDNPDHRTLTRQFPGDRSGYLTDQLAAALLEHAIDGATCVVDLHSGSPTMALGYTYDYGDRSLAASFGLLPVILGHTAPGQLGLMGGEGGFGFLLPEFGGGPFDEVTIGVDGTLNVLRYRGHLSSPATGPTSVPLVEQKRLFRSSVHGVLQHAGVRAGDVGSRIGPQELGRVVDVATGEPIERFVIDDPDSVLLMARTTPMMVQPGDFAYMTGPVADEIPVPRRSS